MKLKAKVSFSGRYCGATKGETFDCDDKAICKDLIDAGYAEEVKDESKRAKPTKRSTSGERKS